MGQCWRAGGGSSLVKAEGEVLESALADFLASASVSFVLKPGLMVNSPQTVEVMKNKI